MHKVRTNQNHVFFGVKAKPRWAELHIRPTITTIARKIGVLIPADRQTIVGYALYFFIYSTFEGRSSFLEDLYVTQKHRGQGIGTALWKKVAQVGILHF